MKPKQTKKTVKKKSKSVMRREAEQKKPKQKIQIRQKIFFKDIVMAE